MVDGVIEECGEIFNRVDLASFYSSTSWSLKSAEKIFNRVDLASLYSSMLWLTVLNAAV